MDEREGNARLILGDFNSTLDFARDTTNYQSDPHPKVRGLPRLWMLSRNFLDCYDEFHPGKESLIWFASKLDLAVDCTFFIERSENNLRKTVNILNLFWEISGLKCNISKTKVIPVGVFDGENICEDLKLSWENDFTILGIEIDNKLKNLSKIFDKLYNDTRSIISRWTGYDLSFHGKITVCKTLLISQYTYVGSILDCITSDQMKLIQKQMDCFINHGKNTPKDETIKKKNYGLILILSVTAKKTEVLDVST